MRRCPLPAPSCVGAGAVRAPERASRCSGSGCDATGVRAQDAQAAYEHPHLGCGEREQAGTCRVDIAVRISIVKCEQMAIFEDSAPRLPMDPGTARGRPPDPNREAAILRAALEGLAEHGYDRLTMDQIAALAHAGKGALYRRWSSKAALVVEAVIAWRSARAPVAVPDTGSVRGDLDAALTTMRELDEHDQAMLGVFLGLVTAAYRDPELAAVIDSNLLEVPRRALREVFDRGVRRGEIPPDRDLSLVPDMIIGLNFVRSVTGKPLDRAYSRRVFDDLVLPLALDREGLEKGG
jgi:AcrR family transcriptional regulator